MLSEKGKQIFEVIRHCINLQLQQASHVAIRRGYCTSTKVVVVKLTGEKGGKK